MKRYLIYTLLAIAPLLGIRAEVTASLLTASPGELIYELDGHTGLRLNDPSRGMDVVINWGIFDFDSPNFVYRFVKGETDYLCAAVPTDMFVNSYIAQGRKVTEQVLDLTPDQADALMNMALMNILPQNRVYRYSYIYDNCATRPLLMIEKAVGRKLIPDGEPSGLTFREEMATNHRLYPWYQFGIDLALGAELDTPISSRQLAFSPLRLNELLDDSGIVRTTIRHGEATLTHSPTQWWLTPAAIGWLVAAITLAVSIRDFRRRRLSRWLDSVEFTIFGLCGCVIAFLVIVSSHSATSPNWLLVWLNPLCFAGAILPWIKSAKKWVICYHFANFAVLIVWLMLWPLTGQTINMAFIPWILSDLIRSVTNIYICQKN